MAGTTKTPSKVELKKLAEQIIKLREAGKGWPEIVSATGVKGPATGRRLMREHGGESVIVKQNGKGSAKPKKAAPKKPARRAAKSTKS